MIQVFPTRNIHLVTAFPAAQIDLSACIDWPILDPAATWTDLTTVPGAQMFLSRTPSPATGPEPAFVFSRTSTPASPTGISVRARDVGASFYRLLVVAQAKRMSTVLRIATHKDVVRLFLPYGDIYMFVGRDDFVLTVFAQFDDGEQWDVSEHPYLEYGSDHDDIARIDPQSGRVTAVSPGDALLWAQPLGRANQRKQCRVHVATIASWVANKNIEVRRSSRPAGADRRLYVVSEGYVDKDRFEQHASEVGERIFGEANAPFRWVRDRFEVIKIYVRSAGTRGITLGPPLTFDPAIHTVVPIEPRHISADPHALYDPARLGAFGLMYGARVGDVDAPLIGETGITAAKAMLAWAGDKETRALSVDMRRVGAYRSMGPPVQMHDPRDTFVRGFTDLLSGLGLTFGDHDRVVFLTDDQLRGGARFSVGGMSLKNPRFVSMTIGVITDTFDGAQRTAGSPLLLRVGVKDFYNADYVATSVVHELGHTYRLGDEYEGDDPSDSTYTANDNNRLVLEEFDNLQLKDDVMLGGSVMVDRLKWHVPRAAKVSRVTKVDPLGPGTSLTIQIDGDAARTWKANELVRLRSSYATPRRRQPDGTVDKLDRRVLDFAFVITSIQGNQIALFSQDAGPTDLDQLVILYAPVAGDHDLVRLIDPVVETYLHDHGAFARNVAPPCTPTDADGAPPQIPGLKMPTFPADLIGVYEGGYQYSCGVIRPSGRCKMRGAGNAVFDATGTLHVEVREFCFVCKFIIADQIDPTVLPKVQVHYPKDC